MSGHALTAPPNRALAITASSKRRISHIPPHFPPTGRMGRIAPPPPAPPSAAARGSMTRQRRWRPLLLLLLLLVHASATSPGAAGAVAARSRRIEGARGGAVVGDSMCQQRALGRLRVVRGGASSTQQQQAKEQGEAVDGALGGHAGRRADCLTQGLCDGWKDGRVCWFIFPPLPCHSFRQLLLSLLPLATQGSTPTNARASLGRWGSGCTSPHRLERGRKEQQEGSSSSSRRSPRHRS